jgi:hypothetical protein
MGVAQGQQIVVTHAQPQFLPGGVDSNSPAWWSGAELRVLTSEGQPFLSKGSGAADLAPVGVPEIGLMDHYPFWMESVWRDGEGVLFGWYHHEPWGVCDSLTAPMIGAAYSKDDGESWHDLGIVLSAAEPADCEAKNGYFAGGHGDFTVIPDRAGRFLYFFFGNYGGGLAGQGIAMARMSIGERWAPVGAVWKYRDNGWREPGLNGRLTPVFRAQVAWQDENTDAFWGPSIHWNSYLGAYVMLMNRACCSPGWPQEGVYATFNRDLSRPGGWTTPVKILDGFSDEGEALVGWYPQVLGNGPGETDSVAGQRARLYLAGASYWEVEFVRPVRNGAERQR